MVVSLSLSPWRQCPIIIRVGNEALAGRGPDSWAAMAARDLCHGIYASVRPGLPHKSLRKRRPAVDAQLGLPFSCAARDSLRPRTAEAPTGSACGAEGLGATVRRSCPAPPRPSFRAHHCAASLLPQVRSVAGFPATQAAGSGRQASFWAGGW